MVSNNCRCPRTMVEIIRELLLQCDFLVLQEVNLLENERSFIEVATAFFNNVFVPSEPRANELREGDPQVA